MPVTFTIGPLLAVVIITVALLWAAVRIRQADTNRTEAEAFRKIAEIKNTPNVVVGRVGES